MRRVQHLPEDRRAELIVSEILDTELIGEGVLGTMAHAHAALAAPSGVEVIPRSAVVRAVLVQSDLLRSWHDVHAATVNGLPLGAAAAASGVVGRMVDVHADALEGHVTLLSDPFDAYDFDFTSSPSLEGRVTRDVRTTKAGAVDAVLVWWDTHLDEERCLSTAPRWLDNRPARSWRDHWRQAVYLLPAGQTKAERVGDVVRVACEHDEYTLWFDVSRAVDNENSGSSGGGGGGGADDNGVAATASTTIVGAAAVELATANGLHEADSTIVTAPALASTTTTAAGAAGAAAAAATADVASRKSSSPPQGRPTLDYPWNVWNANRLWMLNDPLRRTAMEARVRAACAELPRDECVVALGDTSYLALAAATVIGSRGSGGEAQSPRV
jgi:hypothetical protein